MRPYTGVCRLFVARRTWSETNQPISEAVTTDAGTHLILLTERRAGEEASIDDVRPELEEKLQLSAARGEILRIVENLRDQVFNADNLDEPAAELALTVSQSGAINRTGGADVFANAAVISAAFSEDVLELGHNSEVLEVSSDHFVVLRVRQHNTPETVPLEQVRTDIVIALTEEAAQAAVAAKAESALAALRSGQSVENYALENGYEWQVELGADRRQTGNRTAASIAGAGAVQSKDVTDVAVITEVQLGSAAVRAGYLATRQIEGMRTQGIYFRLGPGAAGATDHRAYSGRQFPSSQFAASAAVVLKNSPCAVEILPGG